jgi:hypothetical protein
VKNIKKNNLHLFVYVFTTQDFAALAVAAEVSFEEVEVTVEAFALVAVAAAPQIALRAVEYHFAIAINGALKMLLELGSAVTEDVRSAIFLSFESGDGAHDFFKPSNSACGFW